MPIRRENRHRYPPDWPTIRAAILDRARHRCELCAAPNHALLLTRRLYLDKRKRTWLTQWWDEDRGHWRDAHGHRTTCPTAIEHAALRFVRVVLTIAHLDHQPENCAPENLAALCQRCHLAHDHPLHQAHARETRRRKRAQLPLFPQDP